MFLDYGLIESMPEGTLEVIADAVDNASDGAAPLVLLIQAMRELSVDGETQDAILRKMATLSRSYLAGQ